MMLVETRTALKFLGLSVAGQNARDSGMTRAPRRQNWSGPACAALSSAGGAVAGAGADRAKLRRALFPPAWRQFPRRDRDAGLSGASGRFALGPRRRRNLRRREWNCFSIRCAGSLTSCEVRLVNPVVRAKVDELGRVTLPSLQAWLDSWAREREIALRQRTTLPLPSPACARCWRRPQACVEINGDAKIVRNRPVSLALTASRGSSAGRAAACGWQRWRSMLTEAGRIDGAGGGRLSRRHGDCRRRRDGSGFRAAGDRRRWFDHRRRVAGQHRACRFPQRGGQRPQSAP